MRNARRGLRSVSNLVVVLRVSGQRLNRRRGCWDGRVVQLQLLWWQERDPDEVRVARSDGGADAGRWKAVGAYEVLAAGGDTLGVRAGEDDARSRVAVELGRGLV